jgi:hypothetical protein
MFRWDYAVEVKKRGYNLDEEWLCKPRTAKGAVNRKTSAATLEASADPHGYNGLSVSNSAQNRITLL